jgi:long-subunit acyl-CoA synthetase (AMP-forming)
MEARRSATTLVGASAIEDALSQPTLCAAFQVSVAANAERPALKMFGDAAGSELTWAEYGDRVRSVATGLSALGVGPGDVIGTMMNNRTEFHLVDTAALHLGAETFGIYQTNPRAQIMPLLTNSGARILVTEPAFLELLSGIKEEMGQIEYIVVADSERGSADLTMSELEELSAGEFDFDASWRSVKPTTLVSINYTSGTTGVPKAVEWDHAAMLAHIRLLHQLVPVRPGTRWISHLPMALITERYLGHYAGLVFGYEVTSVPNVRDLPDAIAAVHPQRMWTVPRLYEKLVARAAELIEATPRLGGVVEREVARVRAEAAPAHPYVPSPEAQRALAPLRDTLGIDALEWCGLGGAPSRLEMVETLMALGMPIGATYGLTETLLYLSYAPDKPKPGTIGTVQPGMEIKVAEDGELLCRGPMFSRYRGDPDLSRAVRDDEGWFATGDVVAVDDDGYTRIIDRKKDIIITSGGKNVSSLLLEVQIKQQSALVGHVIPAGDQKPYMTALITVDEDALARFAEQHGLSGAFAHQVASEEVQAEISRAVAAANAGLARSEQVKRFKVLDVRWEPGGAELTATLKPRRRAIIDTYAELVESLYEAGA